MDRKGFLPIFSTESAREGTTSFQRGISGRATNLMRAMFTLSVLDQIGWCYIL